MPPRPLARDGKPVKILHVEDNPENRLLVRAILSAEGYTVVEAEDGLSGIEAALRETPTLILLDINLPSVDGYEVAGILRSFPTLSSTVIVAVTAYAMEGDRQRTLVAGCDGYVQKPIDVDAFPAQVAEFLQGKRERVEEREAGVYLRELNQRLVYRLLTQVEELKHLNQHFFRRASQLEDLHRAIQDLTSELDAETLLRRLLPLVARALGTLSLTVELTEPAGVKVSVVGEATTPGTVLAGAGREPVEEWTDVEWRLNLAVRGRSLGTMVARQRLPAGAKVDEEQLLKIVANQVAIAVENSRLFENVTRRAAREQSLTEASRLLAGTLNLEEILTRLAELVRERMGVDGVTRIWLHEGAGGLRLRAQAGVTQEAPPSRIDLAPGAGVVAAIVERRETVVVADLASDPRVRNRDGVRAEGLVSFLGIPLLLDGQAVGVLSAMTRTPHAFSLEEIGVIEALATSAAVAIGNARLHAETEERLRHTETLLAVTQASGSTLDLAEIGRRTVREMARALGADMGGAWCVSRDGRAILPLAGYHVPRPLLELYSATVMGPDDPLVRRALALTGPLAVEDSQADPRFDHPLARVLPHRSLLLCPMRVKDESIGGFGLVWTRAAHGVSPEELRLVEGIARQAAIAIENARLLEAEREARAQLQISERQYRELFENVLDVVYVHDLDGRLLAVNPAGVAATGYALDDLLGMNVRALMGETDFVRLSGTLALLAGGQAAPELFTFDLVRRDGTRRIMEASLRLIQKEGVPAAVQAVARDITGRRALERRQAAFVEIVKELAAEADFDRLFALIGRRACELAETDCAVISLVEGEDIVLRGAWGLDPDAPLTRRRPIAESRVGRVILQQKPFATSDMASDPHWQGSTVVTEVGIRAILDVPIILRNQVIGVLGALSRSPRVFTEDDVALLVSFAEHTAVALDRMQLLATLETRLRETETLLTVSQAAGATLDVTEVARRTTREMVRALGADCGGSWLLDPAGSRLTALAGYRLPPALLPTFRRSVLHITDPFLAGHGGPVYASDSQADPRFDHPVVRLVRHRSALTVPMHAQGELVGAFTLVWTRAPHAFTADELRLVEGIARQAAIAIENARLLEAEREARESLEASETRYRELFDNVIDIVYLHDFDGRILAVNEAAVRATGFSREELLRKRITDLLQPEPGARRSSILPAGEEGIDLFTAELVTKDGQRRILESRGRVIYKVGRPVAILGSARDITLRRQLETRQETLVALSRDLGTEVDLERLLPRVAEQSRRLMGADASILLLLEGDELVFRGVAGIEPELAKVGRLPLRGSLTGAALLERRPMVSPDLAEDPAWRGNPLPQQFGYRAMLAVPILLQDRPFGVLKLLQREVRDFTESEVEFLGAIGTQAALAIDNARLFQQTQRRLQETETLLTVSQEVSSTLDPTETMRRVARQIAQVLGADMVGAYRADDAGDLRPIAGYRVPKGMVQEFLDHPIPLRGHAFAVEAWESQRAVWTSDAAHDPRLDRASVERFPSRTLLFIPMVPKGEPIGGFFAVWWEVARDLRPEELRLVEGISHQAAIFIENARLYSEATRRRREAEELARLARMLTESLDVADVGQRTVTSALLLLGGSFATLRLLEPEGALKVLARTGSARDSQEPPAVLPGSAGLVGRAVVEGVPLWSSDLAAEVEAISMLVVPLRVKREIIGALSIADAVGRRFSEAEVTLLQTFADQAAIALENSRLYGELRGALRAVEESQQRIVQGERLRALGQMAGGVAHDFNNTLAIVVGRAEVLLTEATDPEVQRQLNVIIKVALDASQTVRRIQEFTRMRRARPFQLVNLNQLLDELVEVTRSRWKDEAQAKGLSYEVVVEGGAVPPVMGDPSELREALLNIVFNALDAMPEGGRLTFSSELQGDRVVCSVADTGTGMTEDVRQRVFDPFFTTKGERGTGLGLSVVYGIVNRHGGELDVQSEPGRGSTFSFRLPVGQEGAEEAVRRAPVRSPRRGRILVVDDEKEVRDVLMDLLALDRHSVVMCPDGESAVARFQEEPFDLVITDLGMPGVSGWDVARVVKQGRPETPVCMVTGWGDRIDETDAKTRGVDYVVSKPFKREEIREVVALALGAHRRLAGSAPQRGGAGPG